MTRLRGITTFLALAIGISATTIALTHGIDETHLAAKVNSSGSMLSLKGWGEHHMSLQEYVDKVNAFNAAQAAAKAAAEQQAQEAAKKKQEEEAAVKSVTQHTSLAKASRSSSKVEACIVASESGGNYYPHDNPTHFGKYQYDRQTWASHGGNPDHWGTASPEEQEAVFRNGVNKYGYSAWTPYDGC